MSGFIKVRGAREHTLKNINVDIPQNKLVVFTGLSGSGKSSLAFDTIYAEGQRRYVESLSAYARQFLQLQKKPDVDSISGLSPAIAIDQKTTSKNPRSTVGTITEIYDYLRLLYARIGIPYSPVTGLPITSQTISEMVTIVTDLPIGTKIYILAPIARGQKGEFRKELANIKRHGFQKIILDGELYDIDNLPKIDKNKTHNIEVIVDRLEITENLGNRVAESLETSVQLGEGITYIEIFSLPADASGYQNQQRIILSEKYSCPVSGFKLEEIEPRIFSFNSPFGACPKCEGLGKESFFDPALIVPDETLSIKEGAIVPWSKNSSKIFFETIASLARHYKFELTTPFKDLPARVKKNLLYGSEEEIKFEYSNDRKVETISQAFAGIIPSLEEKLRKLDSSWMKEDLERFQSKHRCSACSGYRLKAESLCVKIDNLNIGQTADKTIAQGLQWIEEINPKLNNKQQLIASTILKEIKERLSFLINVGLDYLSLSRESGSLSGGESQRIRLASQIGSGLSGVLYVLDEPSIGLHQRDNSRLIATLKNLRDLGNTVIVVEHDDETMLEADHIIDIGPGAGIHGGKIIAQGTPDDIKNSPDSITGSYLSGRSYIPIPEKIRQYTYQTKEIILTGAKSNNLQNITFRLKLGMFTVVTGVSGSGKSTLLIHTFYKAALKHLEPGMKLYPGEYESISGLEYIDKIIDIDQSPIGRTPRSNPATYTGAFSPIREWFTELPESKIRGYKVGRFSFNVKGGRCESCQGDGLIKIEMHFLPDVFINCDMCNGKRYNRETLEVKYKGKNIADVLDMTVEDATVFFEKVPVIYEKLKTLQEVGLGYIKIGQSATTLSGGEAQRIKLAKELSRRSTGKTLYILDEPTTGLHVDDIKKLLTILHKFVEKGNTVLVIEHNMDVIKTADYIIDIGPEGGDKGGRIVVEGTPGAVAAHPESHTGRYLQYYLKAAKNKSGLKA